MRPHPFFNTVDIYIMDAEFVRDSWDAFYGYSPWMRIALVIYVRLCWLAGSCGEDE